MPLYINKSVLVNAVQYQNNFNELAQFVKDSNAVNLKELNGVVYIYVQTAYYPGRLKQEIETLVTMPGDFIVKDATGFLSHYPEDHFNDLWFAAPANFKI